jgi:hypothetical protein
MGGMDDLEELAQSLEFTVHTPLHREQRRAAYAGETKLRLAIARIERGFDLPPGVKHL